MEISTILQNHIDSELPVFEAMAHWQRTLGNVNPVMMSPGLAAPAISGLIDLKRELADQQWLLYKSKVDDFDKNTQKKRFIIVIELIIQDLQV